MTDREKKLARQNGTTEHFYKQAIKEKIRLRYSVEDEIGIIRQKDSKPEEFAEYNAYIEQCKIDAKAKFGL